MTHIGRPPLSEERFREDPDTHCWIWLRSRTLAGYGQWTAGVLAHRVMYEALVGPIPDGLTLDHLCRNRACCNPGHLEPVTMAENLLRGVGPTATNARKTKCVKGHPLSGDNLYRDPRGRRQCRSCRREANREWDRRRRARAKEAANG